MGRGDGLVVRVGLQMSPRAFAIQGRPLRVPGEGIKSHIIDNILSSTSRLAQLVERVTSNDEVSRSSRLMGTPCATLCFCSNHVCSNKIHALEHATCVFIY